MNEIYLDNNATAPIAPWVRKAVEEYLDDPGANASSPHAAGETALRWLESARLTIADALNVEDRQLVFTSSGTESNDTVLRSAADSLSGGRNVIVTTSAEHASILSTCDVLRASGVQIRTLPVDRCGLVDTSAVQEIVDQRCALVSVQWVNNETGVIQPIKEIVKHARSVGAFMHTDAAQAVGRFPVDLEDADVDFATITGHKLHGPGGTGALFAKNPKSLIPFLTGGDQESGIRAGTHNLIGIVGFAAALRNRVEHLSEHIEHMRRCRDLFETELRERVSRLTIVGNTDSRVCNTSNVIFPEIEDGQAFFARIVDSGVACSQASACHSQRPEPSYVLRAMGFNENEAFRAIRFSFSVLNTEAEAISAAERVADLWDASARHELFAGHEVAEAKS